MAPPRVLHCGDVRGRLNQLVKRILSVHKAAGPFDAVLCAGQFFPDSPEQLQEFMDYIEGRSQEPLPMYFIGDYGIGAAKVLSSSFKESGNLGFKMDGLRICDNLYWLKCTGKFTLHGRKSLRAQFDDKFSFFCVELPDGTVLLHVIEENEKFPAQFGCEVLSGLLNITDRADWWNCKQNKDVEIKMAEVFKNQFKKFDPNI